MRVLTDVIITVVLVLTIVLRAGQRCVKYDSNICIEGQSLLFIYLYLATFQTKMKFKRSRSKSLGKSEDEGFESPSSPCTISPVTPLNSLTDIVPKAPLANGEDLEEEEKHEKEATKENPSQELTVSVISHHQANLYSRTVQLYMYHKGVIIGHK